MPSLERTEMGLDEIPRGVFLTEFGIQGIHWSKYHVLNIFKILYLRYVKT